MTPRRASEQLVAEALDRVGSRSARVVDVGTGSGAIAVAIAAAAEDVQVFATDTSRCAVALARANVRRHGLSDRVTVCRGDLLEPVPGPIDLVVANLPYLPGADAGRYPELADEPAAAVFASGDGLDRTGAYWQPARSGWMTKGPSSSSCTGVCSRRPVPSCLRFARGSNAPRRHSATCRSWRGVGASTAGCS